MKNGGVMCCHFGSDAHGSGGSRFVDHGIPEDYIATSETFSSTVASGVFHHVDEQSDDERAAAGNTTGNTTSSGGANGSSGGGR